MGLGRTGYEREERRETYPDVASGGSKSTR